MSLQTAATISLVRPREARRRSAVVVVSLMAQGEGAISADCLRHVIAAVAGGAFGGALCLNRGGGKRKKRARRR